METVFFTWLRLIKTPSICLQNENETAMKPPRTPDRADRVEQFVESRDHEHHLWPFCTVLGDEIVESVDLSRPPSEPRVGYVSRRLPLLQEV